MRRQLAIPIALSIAVLGALPSSAGAATATGDEAIANAAVLTAGDFPSTWSQAPRDTSGDAATDKVASKIPSCRQFAAFRLANKKYPRAESDDFDLDQSSLSNTVTAFPSEQAAADALKTFASKTVAKCLDALFTAVLKTQLAKDTSLKGKLKSVESSVSADPGLQIGDDSVAYAGSTVITLKGGGGKVTLDLGNEAVRVGRVINDFAYTADTDISAVATNAINRSVARLVAALAASS
jgi:hypothetical protein